jgi:hypothetical protein
MGRTGFASQGCCEELQSKTRPGLFTTAGMQLVPTNGAYLNRNFHFNKEILVTDTYKLKS